MGREEWLQVSRGLTDLRVSLPRSSNFFQLPVVIRTVREEGGAVMMTADVCATRRCDSEEFLWKNLRLVSVSTTYGTRPFSPGERGQLLGLFSVNLKVALEGSAGAVGQVSVPDALEFFVFGRTRLLPAKNSRCELERDDRP